MGRRALRVLRDELDRDGEDDQAEDARDDADPGRTKLGAAAYERILLRLDAHEGGAGLRDFEQVLHRIPEVAAAPDPRAER